MWLVLPGHRALTMRPFTRKYSRHAPFSDSVKILVSSGAGGDGANKMLHLHMEEYAGPGGGNGGRGGCVYLRCARKRQDLNHIKRLGKYVSAGIGRVGKTRTEHGSRGNDLTLDLPLGTQVTDVDTNDVIFDLDTENTEVLLLDGGTGGKGNASFASASCHSPKHSTRGLPGNTMLAQFELKSIADCGLVGLPNAGKSTLLSAISSCQPRIAPYPFTTMHPLVGKIQDMFGNSCDVADLPGLIEGAYENRGLGHQFLRHVERTQVIAYVVDMSDSYAASEREAPQEPWEAVELLQQELEYYLPGLSDRATMVFCTKMDKRVDAAGVSTESKFQRMRESLPGLQCFPVSAAEGAGLADAVGYLCNDVFARKAAAKEERRLQRQGDVDEVQRLFQERHRGLFPNAMDRTAADEYDVAFRSTNPGEADARYSDAPRMFGAGSFQAVAPQHRGNRGDMAHQRHYEGGGGDDEGGAAASLVDQQLGSLEGESGFGDSYSAYHHLPESGRLPRVRDNTMRGAYWKLSRQDDEVL
jgi:GTP-binding protein